MLHDTKKAKAIIDYASGDPEISSVDPDLLASADLRSFSADPTFSLDSMGQSSPSGSRSMSVSSSISDEDPHRRSGAVVKNRSSMSSSCKLLTVTLPEAISLKLGSVRTVSLCMDKNLII